MPMNPYVNTDKPPVFTAPVYASPVLTRYASPEGNAPYSNGGWSPALHETVGSTPDPGRLATLPLFEERPVPNRPPEEWYRPQDADKAWRSNVEMIDSRGWPEQIGADGHTRFARNPRENPPLPNRVTSVMSPNTYMFWRGMGHNNHNDTPAQLTGVHFSMADHRRDYPVLGMQPQRKPGAGTRNTYRLEPAPWDSNIVDVPPPASEGLPQAEIQAPTGPTSLSRSGRLF